eukprot:5982508-Prymnesium_polylepis.3
MAESPAGWSPCETWTAAVPSADWRPSIQECEYACADGERLAVECFPRRVGWMVLVADGALRLVAGLDVRQIVSALPTARCAARLPGGRRHVIGKPIRTALSRAVITLVVWPLALHHVSPCEAHTVRACSSTLRMHGPPARDRAALRSDASSSGTLRSQPRRLRRRPLAQGNAWHSRHVFDRPAVITALQHKVQAPSQHRDTPRNVVGCSRGTAGAGKIGAGARQMNMQVWRRWGELNLIPAITECRKARRAPWHKSVSQDSARHGRDSSHTDDADKCPAPNAIYHLAATCLIRGHVGPVRVESPAHRHATLLCGMQYVLTQRRGNMPSTMEPSACRVRTHHMPHASLWRTRGCTGSTGHRRAGRAPRRQRRWVGSARRSSGRWGAA